jgi:hypothetical protein
LRLSGAPRRRYLDDPASAATVFRPDGWIRTGDLGYTDEDGYLYLVDRASDRIISGGTNVSAIEVEATLMEFPGVLEAAVVGLPHPVLGQYVAAALRTIDNLPPPQLRDYLDQRLGTRAPKRLTILSDLPRNAMGKVVKSALRDRLTSGSDDVADQPTTPLEESLHRLWQETLRPAHLPMNVSFIELGGTSLTAMEVVERVRDEIGHDIGQNAVFEATGLRDFARRVETAPALDPARPGLGAWHAHRPDQP